MPSPLCADCGHSVTCNIEVPISPAPKLLGSNQVAPTTQAPTIRRTVANTQRDISRLDLEINRLYETAHELRQKRDALQTFNTMHRALISPVHHMPPEILSEIFIQCQDTAPFDPTDRDGGVRLDKAPLLLGKICSRWRCVSLSTPKLWASIQLSVEIHNAESRVMMAKTWLARSGTCLLSIALNIRRGYKKFSSLELLMQVLLKHCNRWRRIYFCMPLPDIKCFSPAKNCIPQLQQLLVNVRNHIGAPPPTYKEAIDIFECAPQLHRFNLAPGFPTSLLKVPYHQLKHLDLQERSATETLNFLGLTPNLETCTVSPTSRMQESQYLPVLLRNLRYIHISIRTDLGNFFDRLSLPMLRELSIDLQDGPWMAVPELICLFSQGSLEKFSFHSGPSHHYLYESDMIKVLLAAPSLVELDLSGNSPQFMTKSFLTQFTYHCKSEQVNVPQLLPRLHTIKVDYMPSSFDILAFADAVQSRMMVNRTGGASQGTASAPHIRRVQIRWFPAYLKVTEPFDSIALSRWEQLQDLGLDLSIIPGRVVVRE